MALLVVAWVRGLLAQPGFPVDETFSANRKFSVELSQNDTDKSLLTVYRRDGEQKSVLWSKALVPEEQMQLAAPYNTRRVVTDDGRYVIMRSLHFGDDQPFLQLLQQKGDPIRFDGEQVSEVAGIDLDYESGPARERTFELLLDSEEPPLYAIWFESALNWIALELSTGKLRSADHKVQERLDATALARARALVKEHQPGLLKRLLEPVRRTAAQIPGFEGVAAPDTTQLSTDVAGAYRFLAAKKNPEDKQSIQQLLEREIENVRNFGGPFGAQPVFYSYSQERALGDELLAKWDKGIAADDDLQGFEWQRKLNYLGSLSGVVRLPFPLNDQRGAVHVYLIPDSVAKNEWDSSDGVIELEMRGMPGPRMMMRPGMEEPDGPSQFAFVFGTLSPGQYRLKAVWDRRPPHEPPGPKTKTRPSDGDYEASETSAFKIAAGDQLEKIVLYCTNRVGTADAYFAADERWKASHPPDYPEPDEAMPRLTRSARDPVLFSSAAANWVLRTNEASDRIYLSKIRVVQSREYPLMETAKYVRVRFVDRTRKKDDYNSHFEGVLTDEHGCQFRSGTLNSSGKWSELLFNPFPYHAKKLSLDITETRQESGRHAREATPERVLSLILTNLIATTPEKFDEPVQPARKQLDKVSVELLSMSSELPEGVRIMGQGPPTWAKFRYLTNGKEDQEDYTWRTESLVYLDRWGNSSPSTKGFCEEEKVLKLKARFSRDFELSDFSADEKWEIPIAKVPGAGELIVLGLKKELAGNLIEVAAIGGPGEFTYRNGRLLSATNRLTSGRPGRGGRSRYPGDFDPNAREPRIYYQSKGFPPYMGGPMQPNQPNQIVARVPHLVYRVKPLAPHAQCDLLEQTEEAEMSDRHYYAPPQMRNASSSFKYVALKFRRGEQNQKLTFVAQIPREVEFFVSATNDGNQSN